MPIFSKQAISNGQQATGSRQEATGTRQVGSGVSEAGHDNHIGASVTSANQHISTSAPQHHRPTTPRVAGRDAFATPSIKGALSDSPNINERTSTSAHQHISTSSHPFTQDELAKVWKIFVEKIEAPQLKSALSSRDPKLLEQWRIEYVLDNELQLQRLTLDLKPKLLGYLRRELNNEAIEIEFLISTHHDEKPAVPYTESEKWQSLVEKYPALSALKTKFGLDFES